VPFKNIYVYLDLKDFGGYECPSVFSRHLGGEKLDEVIISSIRARVAREQDFRLFICSSVRSSYDCDEVHTESDASGCDHNVLGSFSYPERFTLFELWYGAGCGLSLGLSRVSAM
jgi:hypothetical protein